MTKLLTHVKHNVVAYLALFVALGGTSYAAVNLPAAERGHQAASQRCGHQSKLGKGAVGPAKLDPRLFAGYVRAYVQINRTGQITASRPAAKVASGVGAAGPVPEITIQWSRPIPSRALPRPRHRASVMCHMRARRWRGGAKGDALTYVSLSGAGSSSERRDHLPPVVIDGRWDSRVDLSP